MENYIIILYLSNNKKKGKIVKSARCAARLSSEQELVSETEKYSIAFLQIQSYGAWTASFAHPLKALGVTRRMQDQGPAANPGLSSATQGIYVLSAKIN